MSRGRRFSIQFFMLASFWFLSKARAIDVVNLYRGSCNVDSGLILKVDDKWITVLGLDGQIQKMPRYDVIGIASYPLPYLPVEQVHMRSVNDVEFFQFYTYRNGALEILGIGWPIEYNEEHIQLLTKDGGELLIRREEIWKVERLEVPNYFKIARKRIEIRPFHLRHPLSFEKCPQQLVGGKGPADEIIPQSVYDDPIRIKKYHDHLHEGYKQLVEYEDHQRFYAVPFYYKNITLLGTWAILGSRYANIGARQINFLPFVQDELAEGPFSYQRIIRSGVYPIEWLLIDEPVVQAFYGLKADYVHLQIFLDPMAWLLGKSYSYTKEQLNDYDDRYIERGGFEFGFDIGKFSLFGATSGGNFSVRAEDHFSSRAFNSNRWGISYQHNFLRFAVYRGTNNLAGKIETQKDAFDATGYKLQFIRLIAEASLSDRHRVKIHYLNRDLTNDSEQNAEVFYDSLNNTFALHWIWHLDYRWTLNILSSFEQQDIKVQFKSGQTDSKTNLFPKIASGITVAF